MKFELFPQTVRIYPEDRQTFEARATPPPPIWIPLSSLPGFVLADGSIRHSWRSPLATSVFGHGAYRLITGIGSIEFTIRDENCLPDGGNFIFTARFKGPSGSPTFGLYAYRVEIHDTDVEIIREGGVTLATIIRTAAVGDKFRIELSSGFRLFINDVLQHERTGLADIQYPASYTAEVDTSIIGSDPTIPPPQLSGNWQLSEVNPLSPSLPTVQFTTPSHGSLSETDSLNGLQTDYFDGTVPGQYKLVAVIDPGMDIWAEDDRPAGSSLSTTGGSWAWGTGSPAHFSASARLKSPSPAGEGFYFFDSATDTLQISVGDILVVYVFIDAGDPTTEIMFQWKATDATGIEHRAYWGANSISAGTDGTPSRRFMGALPATGAWTRLEVPASLVDLEGRVLQGMKISVYDGICSFDKIGKAPNLQRAESIITIAPLEILGDLERTLDPGQVVRLQANYDDAQRRDLLAWSIALAGGSPSITSDGEFTASTTPGTTIVRATSGDQIADLTITVPAIITPNYTFAAPLEQIDWNTNIAAAPVFVAAGTVAEGTGNIQPGLPSGWQEKDIFLLVVNSANEVVAAPSGYVAVADSPQGTGTGGAAGSTRVSVFWKRATAVEAAPTVSDPGDHAIGQIFAYRFCIDSGNPWDVTAGNTAASSTSVSIPGDTTSTPNCLIFQVVAHATDTASAQASGYTNTDLTNLTERSDVSTTQGVGGGFAVVEGQKTTAGAFGATTATLATASAQGLITIALRPNVVVWSSVPSGINASTGIWTLPNDVGRKVQLSVTDGVFTATRDILIMDKFPITRTATPVEGERRKKVLISEAEDGTEVTRVKNKDGLSREYYSVQIKLLTLTDFNTIKAFWEEFHPGKPFIWEDVPQGIRGMFKFDSDLAWREIGSGRFEVAFRVKSHVA